MQQHIFPFVSELEELRNTPPFAPSSHCSSVQERLVNYGSEALDTVEYLGLIIKDQNKAAVLLQHFGSIANLARASVQDLLPFLSTHKASQLVSSLRLAAVALREERSQLLIDAPLAVAEHCAEMRFLSHESLRVILLNTKQQLIRVISVSQGTLKEALDHPREVFNPVIAFSAFAFIMVHNHPSGVIPHPVLYRIRAGFTRESSLVSVDGCGIKRKRLTVVVVEFGMGRCKFHSLDWAALSGRFPYTSNPIWRRSENKATPLDHSTNSCMS
jgi:DNA repair protein RadC